VEATDRKPLSDSLVERAGHIPPGTSLVVITSSLNESLPGALLHYSLAGVRVCAILLDPAEFAGRRTSETDRKFRDNSDRFCAAGAHVYMLPLAEGQPLQLKELFAERSYAYAG
jgi:hypothetical protein